MIKYPVHLSRYINSKSRLYLEQRMKCYGCDTKLPYHKLEKPSKSKDWDILVCDECKPYYHYSSGSLPGCGHSISG